MGRRKKKKGQKTKEVSSVAVTVEEATASYPARAGDDKEGKRKRGRPRKIAAAEKEGSEEGEGEKGGIEGNKRKKKGRSGESMIKEEEEKDDQEKQQVKEEGEELSSSSSRMTTRSRAVRRKSLTPRKSS